MSADQMNKLFTWCNDDNKARALGNMYLQALRKAVNLLFSKAEKDNFNQLVDLSYAKETLRLNCVWDVFQYIATRYGMAYVHPSAGCYATSPLATSPHLRTTMEPFLAITKFMNPIYYEDEMMLAATMEALDELPPATQYQVFNYAANIMFDQFIELYAQVRTTEYEQGGDVGDIF